MSNVTLRNGAADALRIQGTSPSLTNMTIHNNAGWPISMNTASNPAINGISATGNYRDVVRLDSGTLTSGTFTWDDPDITYYLSGTLTVPQETTLNVGPGQIVTPAWENVQLLVNGTLLADGTSAQPIVFISIRDDSGLDGSLGTAEMGSRSPRALRFRCRTA
jgi:hypothetical protein